MKNKILRSNSALVYVGWWIVILVPSFILGALICISLCYLFKWISFGIQYLINLIV